MGMFDNISFAYRMPDGFECERWQTKSFDCTGDDYLISAQGRLVRTYSSGYPDEVRRPIGDINYDGVPYIYPDIGCGDGNHNYDLIFEGGMLIKIYCCQTKSALIFDPVTQTLLNMN